MLWSIQAPAASAEQFSDHSVAEVLYEFDGPRIFTTAAAGLMCLWYESGEDEATNTVRYLVAPTDAKLVSQLKTGRKTVYDALAQPWLWIVDADAARNAIHSWVIHGLDEVPAHAKPQKDAPLKPEFVPVLSYRLVGNGLEEGAIPASVIARAVERPTVALKRVLEALVGDATSQGRPFEDIRKAYDLPATRFAFNSFEVSFGYPQGVQLPLLADGQNVYEASAKKIQDALLWLESPSSAPKPDDVMLEVLKELAPPAHGLVTSAEIRSQFISSHVPVVIDRNARGVITRTISASRALQLSLMQVIGRLGELDKDNFSFILRDRADEQAEIKVVFTEEQFDDVMEVFVNDRRVVIQGRIRAGKNILDLVALEPAPLPPPSTTP
jgi:hypothetical protein